MKHRENSPAYYIHKNISRENQWGFITVQERDKENKQNRGKINLFTQLGWTLFNCYHYKAVK